MIYTRFGFDLFGCVLLYVSKRSMIYLAIIPGLHHWQCQCKRDKGLIPYKDAVFLA